MKRVLGICVILLGGCDANNYQPVVEPEMVSIIGGTFKMGSPSSETAHESDEGPQHDVTVGDYYLGKYEVTVSQFRAFVDAKGYKTDAEKSDGAYVYTGSKWEQKSGVNWRDPLFSQTDSHPVVCVSWKDANAYCKWLSKQTDKKYRLPTEAEWEYACRAGTTAARYWGDSESVMHEYANGEGQSAKLGRDSAHAMPGDDGYAYAAPVGSYKPNGWGLYDMLGNVWEWCSDWYKSDYYESSPIDDPKGPSWGFFRVLRGGGWISCPSFLRSAKRLSLTRGNANTISGFRVARNP